MTNEEYKKIISNAIQSEIEANSFYSTISNTVKDKNLKDLFNKLANDEEKHKITLEGFLNKAPEKLRFSKSKDYRIVDELPTPELTKDLKPVDGIVIAIKKELEAMKMYTQLAKISVDEKQKSIFNKLATMERGHKSKLEDIYTNMAFPEVW